MNTELICPLKTSPSLLDHLLPLQAPVDMAAHFAKVKAHAETGIPMEKICKNSGGSEMLSHKM